jgi:hypothetical protein
MTEDESMRELALILGELAECQARLRAGMIEDARAMLRQAERAGDWQAQLDATLEIDRLSELGP